MRKNCETCKHDRLKTATCDECYNTSDAPTKWEPGTHYKPDTNADRIRAMSDEELAKWIFDNLRWNCRFCSEDKRLVDNILSDELCDRKCVEHAIEWLKQTAE